MKYSARDLAALLRTPLGRHQLASGLRYRAWPLYAVAARIQRRRLEGTRFVAVVGSLGKTTTARATLAALGDDPAGADGANNWSYIARRILTARLGQPHAVVEVGISAPGQMERYARLLRPDVVVVTSIGSEHHRSLGTLEQTRDEKARMVRALRPGGVAVLNGDDPHVLAMAAETSARVVTYGFGPANDVVGSELELDWPRGTQLRVTAGGRSRVVRGRLLGEKMAYSLLAGAAAALVLGRELEQIGDGLERLTPTRMRLETVALPNGAWLIRDEFKSALESVHAALDVLERIPAARKLVVLGDVAEPPGPQGPIYRALGARLATIATLTIVVGENRQRYAAGAARAGGERAAFLEAGRSVARATELLREHLRPGDVVLLKGRDTQRLDRISLALGGARVGCALAFCDAKLRCAACPMLAHGWGDRRVVM